MSSLEHPKVFPNQAKAMCIQTMQAGLVPFLQSSPGMGKSSIARAIAAEGNLELIDLRLSQCAPEDLMGLPMRDGDKARFMPFGMFPLVGDKVPEGKAGWMLFLDEFNSASKSVQAAAYKLVLDRMVGQEHLHPAVVCMAAGNLSTDRAITTQMSTAMQSRLIHILMQSSKDQWVDWAAKAGIDYRIIGFIEFKNENLNTFSPDHSNITFACERTWEFTSRLIKDKPDVRSMLTLLAGTISIGTAYEFVGFCDEYGKIPRFDAILSDPLGTMIPHENSTRFAVLTYCMSYADDKNIVKLIKYIERFPPELQVVFFRSVLSRVPAIREKPEVAKSIINIMRFMNE